MKVLHCIPAMMVGGAERQLSLLARGQAEAGDEVHVALAELGPAVDYLSRDSIRIHRVGVFGNHNPWILFRLIRLIRSIRPDVVQTWLRQMDVFGGLAALATNSLWVLSERSNGGGHQASAKDRLVRRALGLRADAIVANSMGGKAYWEVAAARGTFLHVIPNAIPTELIRSAAVSPLHDIGLSRETPVILFAGRLTPEKNISVFLDACFAICRVTSAVILICGDGILRNPVAERIQAASLTHRIRLLGARSDVWGFMKRADVVVNPSVIEGQPNVVLESATCGVPLVLSDIPAHNELFNAACAEFFETSSSEDLVRAVLSVLGDPVRAAKKAECAAKVVEGYSSEAAVERYRRVYNELLDRRLRCAE